MSIEGWIPDIGSRFNFFGNGVDEEFMDVYEAYEDFYRAAKTPNGRGSVQSKAATEFMSAVIDYYGVGLDEYTAGMGFAGMADTSGFNPLEEKMSEDELYHYLEGQF